MTSRGPVNDVMALSSVNCSNVTTSDLIDLAPRVTGHSPWSILKNQNLSRDCHHRDCHVTLSRKKKPDLNIHFMVAKRPESRIELHFRETPKSKKQIFTQSVRFNRLSSRFGSNWRLTRSMTSFCLVQLTLLLYCRYSKMSKNTWWIDFYHRVTNAIILGEDKLYNWVERKYFVFKAIRGYFRSFSGDLLIAVVNIKQAVAWSCMHQSNATLIYHQARFKLI